MKRTLYLIFSIVLLILGLLFLVPKITGNVSGTSQVSSGFMGIVLLAGSMVLMVMFFLGFSKSNQKSENSDKVRKDLGVLIKKSKIRRKK